VPARRAFLAWPATVAGGWPLSFRAIRSRGRWRRHLGRADGRQPQPGRAGGVPARRRGRLGGGAAWADHAPVLNGRSTGRSAEPAGDAAPPGAGQAGLLAFADLQVEADVEGVGAAAEVQPGGGGDGRSGRSTR